MQNQRTGLGEWVNKVCQQERLSLRQAAERTGLSHATIRDIIHGAAASADTVRKLAQAFSQNHHERLALEDSLLILAGYRTPRASGAEPSQLEAQLLDIVSEFSEPQLKLLLHFAEYLAQMEKK